MEKNKKNILFLFAIISVSSFCFFFFSNDAGAQGIVHCGRSGTGFEERCGLCDLIIGIKAIIDWGRNILIIAGIAAITIGGVMYIVSAGNEEMMERAKNFIKQSLYGVAIVLGAWLIVNTTMWLLASRGDLGIGAASWNEFNCEGGTQGALEVIAVCNNDSVGGCLAGELDGEIVQVGYYLATWTCRLGESTDSCSYTIPWCGLTPCSCLSGEANNDCNDSDTTWTCATANDSTNCPS